MALYNNNDIAIMYGRRVIPKSSSFMESFLFVNFLVFILFIFLF